MRFVYNPLTSELDIVNDPATDTIHVLKAGDTMTGPLNISNASATTAQLIVLAGSAGSPIITLKRTSGATATWSWALAGGGLTFSDDIVGHIVMNMFGNNSVNDVYFGQANKTIPDTFPARLSGTTHAAAAGTDVAAQNLTIQNGLGTGAGAAASILFATNVPTTSGTTPQVSATRLTITSTGITTTVGFTINGSLNVNGQIISQRASTGLAVFQANITGDTTSRIVITTDGIFNWGPGGSTATDTTLYRSAANQLSTGGVLDFGAASGPSISVASTIGDKINLYGSTYGFGVQSNRLVAYVNGTASSFVVRSVAGSGAKSSGTDAVVLKADGTVTATNYATALSTKTTTYTITASDGTILGNHATVAFTITLPTAVSITGRTYTIKNINAATVTVGTTSSQTIDGVTTYTLATQYKYVTVQSDGANWQVIGNN